ncbi:BspA family leucine-rich repeat surface protein [Enterococcus sp. AZ197]|uniref:BspA family leucine-rich repeat surface protein n=1 Tax=unclassified Enterococcus TaxID=2608891 RepID=UPI003D2FF6D9
MLRKTMSIITVISLFSTMLLPVTVMAEEAKSEELNKKETTVLPENKIDIGISDEKLKNNEKIPSGEINIIDNSDGISKTEVTEQEQEENNIVKTNPEKTEISTLEASTYANSNDWEVVDEGSDYLLTKYVGSSTDIVIPNEINGKPTKLKDITKEIFPNYASITSFSVFPSSDGKKVPLVTTNIGSGIFAKSAFDADWGSLNSIDLSGLDVSLLNTTYKMFQYCKARSITLPDFSSGNVRDMSYMFQYAYNLTNLTGLSSFNTSNVTSMRGTFERMYSLENIDVSHFDTSKVTDMTGMFMGARKIKKLDLRNFNTSKVTSMTHMFNDCTSLTDLNVTSFDTSNVNSMSNMFNYTPSLQVIDLSSFKITSSVAQTNYANFVTTSNTSLTVIATDPYFFSYDYSRDKRTVPQILFNANGGNYVNGKTQLNYFMSCAIRPEETSLDKLEEFKQNNLPIKTGFLFNGYTTTTDTSQATSVLDLIGTVYDAQWKTRTVSLEVPTTISFGTHKLSKGTNYYSVDTVEGTSLSITDDRGIGSKWQLTAKLQTPFTNNGKILSNSLVYKTSTGEETITENATQVIVTHTTSTDSEKTVVSDNWTNTQGLMLKLEEGKAYAGEYSGTIEWTLNDTP